MFLLDDVIMISAVVGYDDVFLPKHQGQPRFQPPHCGNGIPFQRDHPVAGSYFGKACF